MILNLASLYAGLLALGLGFAAISKRGKPVLVFSSFSACVGALLCQLLEIWRRVAIRDFSAIEDTIGAVIFASGILLALTLFLNLVALIRGRNKP